MFQFIVTTFFLLLLTLYIVTFCANLYLTFAISSSVTELEILMSVFEAKLNSIPSTSMVYSAESLPDAAPAAPAAPAPVAADPNAPAPPPPAAVSPEVEEVPAAAPAGPMVKDHADYTKFFKMLKVGVPQVVIEGKMRDAGLDPAYLDTPDAPAPTDGSGGAADDAGDID